MPQCTRACQSRSSESGRCIGMRDIIITIPWKVSPPTVMHIASAPAAPRCTVHMLEHLTPLLQGLAQAPGYQRHTKALECKCSWLKQSQAASAGLGHTWSSRLRMSVPVMYACWDTACSDTLHTPYSCSARATRRACCARLLGRSLLILLHRALYRFLKKQQKRVSCPSLARASALVVVPLQPGEVIEAGACSRESITRVQYIGLPRRTAPRGFPPPRAASVRLELTCRAAHADIPVTAGARPRCPTLRSRHRAWRYNPATRPRSLDNRPPRGGVAG